MKQWERIAAAVLTLVGVGAAAQAYTMGFGTFHLPGPGFFPFWLSAILALVSFFYFLTQLGQDPKRAFLWQKGAWVRPLSAGVIMLLYSFLMGWVGFFSSTLILLFAWLTIIEREKWTTVGLVSVLGTMGMYLVFIVFLKVSLPKGVLF